MTIGKQCADQTQNHPANIPLTGARWAARSEAYATLVSEHLHPDTTWLDAGCGHRLLESDMEQLENWLVNHCGRVVGTDVSVTTHCNIDLLVAGSVYALPFSNAKFDLITCNMVAEHLDDPAKAFCELVRCLRPRGALVVHTPNVLNYGVMANAIASKFLPEKWRLRLVRERGREEKDFFPVRYKANTKRHLLRLLRGSGLQVHNVIDQPQRGPYSRRIARLEKLLMPLTPFDGLLVCAHKPDSHLALNSAASEQVSAPVLRKSHGSK